MDADRIAGPLLRCLLAELLRSASDFDAFCLDYFPAVHRQFGNGMDRMQKENLLLQQADAPAAIVVALRERFPTASVWASLGGAVMGSASPATAAQAGYGKKRFVHGSLLVH